MVGNENKGSIITQVLTLGRHEVEGLLSMSEALAEVEKAFKEAVDSPRPRRDREFALSEVFAP